MTTRRTGIRTADMDGHAYDELGALMKEYPDWGRQFPELVAELNPIRFTKNRVNAPKAKNMQISRNHGDPSLSDYQATYIAKQGLRPRSSKRPPPTPRVTRQPPMQMSTLQMEEYRPKFDEAEGRPADFKKEDLYEKPTVKFETQSGYAKDYPLKELPPTERPTGPPDQTRKRKPGGKFDGRTTNKEEFRTWKPERQVCYAELPSFTGSVLYPDQSRNLQTTTATTYQGKLAPKADAIRLDMHNIKLEGDHDFDTVNRGTYKNHPGARPASLIVHKPELITKARSKFDSKTMTSLDYGQKNIRKQGPCHPAQPTIDLKFNNKTSFSTEQRHQYPGIDVTSSAPVVSYKPDNSEYRPPSQKFETQTNQQLDYRPLDVMASYQPPVKPSESRRNRNLPKFVDTTTTKEFFKRWETEPRQQYGDIHEALQFVRSDVFIPTREPFNTVSTTKDTYKGARSDVREPFIPAGSSIETEGVHDFRTMYRSTYDGPQMEKTLTKSQAAKLLAELRRRKNAGPVSAPVSGARMGHKAVAARC